MGPSLLGCPSSYSLRTSLVVLHMWAWAARLTSNVPAASRDWKSFIRILAWKECVHFPQLAGWTSQPLPRYMDTTSPTAGVRSCFPPRLLGGGTHNFVAAFFDPQTDSYAFPSSSGHRRADSVPPRTLVSSYLQESILLLSCRSRCRPRRLSCTSDDWSK